MKAVLAISLLGILLFNWVGFRLLVSYMEDQSNNRLEARIDSHQYEESALISLKVPITGLSYYSNSQTFDRVDGQIEINGILYQYVKRRLYNDSIELLCIPNLSSMRLENVKDDFFKITNDLQNAASQNRKNSSHLPLKNLISDFIAVNLISNNEELFTAALRIIENQFFQVPYPSISKPEQPPRIS